MPHPVTLIAALLISVAGLSGQPDGTLRGVVRDQTGAVLPNAAVELLDAAGATVATASTDAAGAFRFDRLPRASYVVRARFEGFKPGAVQARLGGTRPPAPLAITLELASVPQEVSVNAGDDVIAASAARNRDAVGVTDSDIRDIPVFDRDVVATLSRFLDASSLGSGGATLVVDGMEARTIGVSPSAIQSIKINQDPYSSEFPRPGRGRIEVVTKAGADAYHGSFDFTFRDSALNARDPFAPTTPPEQRRIYEGVLGGPVADGRHSSFLFTIERRALDLQSIVYAAGPAGLINQIVAAPTTGTEVSGSLNHQQGKNNTFFARVTAEVNDGRNQSVGGTTLAEAGTNDHGDEEQVIIGARSIITPRLLNEFRWLLGREITSTASLNPAARITVLDAFTGGGAQADQSTSEYHFNLTESLTYLHGRHLIKGGFAIPDFSRRGYDDRTNRTGTFTFSSLDDYSRGVPLSFVQQRGDGNLAFLQKVFGAFVQDQITVGDRFSVTPGLRYDWQNIFTDNNNVAPRLSAALALDKKTALRGGAGIFYDRAGDSAIHEVLRSRENRLQRYIIVDPAYPDPFAGVSADGTPPSIVTLAPGLRTPYTVQFGGGVERQLRKGSSLAVTYLGSRGVDLFRSRDVNAPPPPSYLARPDPSLGQVRQIESTGRQTVHSLQVLASGRLLPRLQGNLQYTFSSAHNDTSGINALPANNYDLPGEYGRADFDQRHHLEGLLQVKGGDWLHLGIAVSLLSGRPYSLRTGTDPFSTGQTNARPSGVGRNTLDGPGYASVDVKWTREFALTGKKGDDAPAWSVGVSAFNILNHVNYVGYVGTLTSPLFGQPIAAQPPRRIQLSAEFHF
ncbi:MAG TPA: TonB-dependent receptor [Vicinamibacterales bacterium]